MDMRLAVLKINITLKDVPYQLIKCVHDLIDCVAYENL